MGAFLEDHQVVLLCFKGTGHKTEMQKRKRFFKYVKALVKNGELENRNRSQKRWKINIPNKQKPKTKKKRKIGLQRQP